MKLKQNPLNPRSGEEIRYFPCNWDIKLILDLFGKRKAQYKEKPMEKYQQPRVCLFSKLALGAKFRYKGGHKTTWVKIGANLIAEWDENQIDTAWIGQQVCCFHDPYKDEEIIKIK